MTAMASAPLPFGFGQFFGKTNLRRQVEGFEIARLVPTVPEREVERHTHLEAHFVLVLAGTYVSSAEGIAGLCGPATLIYNPPGTTHADCFRSDTGCFLTVSIAREAFQMARDALRLDGGPRRMMRTAVPLALQLARSCVQGSAAAPDPESLCLELLTLTGETCASETSRAPGWLAQARAYLDDCWNEQLSLREVAASLGVHPVHLTRTFRRHLRQTPGEYLRARRVNHSLALLARPSASLAEVALACGFADQSHFTKVFSRMVGVPPGEYRRLAFVPHKTTRRGDW